ncbi:hypothetical protein E2C01_059767 [Portunus trituberculatus]|uniref:Uncharacterized protein n=1 Tax=Portunus trituberculatus TaxID=210409 RepID=A0A5B7H752_PORTR|nr:hypothetical protein [Portunus trituberculatus]
MNLLGLVLERAHRVGPRRERKISHHCGSLARGDLATTKSVQKSFIRLQFGQGSRIGHQDYPGKVQSSSRVSKKDSFVVSLTKEELAVSIVQGRSSLHQECQVIFGQEDLAVAKIVVIRTVCYGEGARPCPCLGGPAPGLLPGPPSGLGLVSFS